MSQNAAAGFSVKIGINPISWSNDDLPSLGGETPLEEALSEGKAIGYQGFELGNKFPRQSAALRKVLSQHGLELVSGWYSGQLARRSAEEEIRAVGPHLELLADNGAKVMVYGEVADSIQANPRRCTSARAFPAGTVAGVRRQVTALARTRFRAASGGVSPPWVPTWRRPPMSIDSWGWW
jgi:inosose dehydratase